ncbi:hypothetical protein BDF20DRAFT_831179 [Mycotypha africana]|uniref:uncharacterized protein n=1 Tax=Mycotypha africana TaxID=64632 RepID=UPI00230082C1|nr:uncharacterized protein BDF20DRAFT_831179 [Mycotypha africana]KAI8991100.1 hypothetical protein BDF20DRAFT_831179 [Mycotypha africana]
MTAESSSYTSVKDKVVVITGGSQGIGKAIADALIDNGAKVVIGDILEQKGQEAVAAYNKKAGSKVAVFIRTDVTKYEDNLALFKLADTEFGKVDHALLGAGIATNANSNFTALDDHLETNIFDVNVTGLIKGTKVALLYMAKRGGGSIVHIASVAGFYSSPGLSSYSASKHAVVGYTRSFQLMPHICNVRVNALCPYWVETDLIRSVSNATAEDDLLYADIVKNSPRTPMSTVIDAFFTLITDESRNTQTLMALPDGLEIMTPPVPLASFGGEATKAAHARYVERAIVVGKQRVAEQIEKYGI